MLKRERISKLVGLSAAPPKMPLESHPYFHEYFRLWNQLRYYEAHDVLEQIWLDENYAGNANFLKGLIQAAGAFVHLQKNFEHPTHAKHSRRLKPAVRLFQLAEKNLASFAPTQHGLDVAALLELLRNEREKITQSDFQANPWSPAQASRLELSLRKN